jgi:hypothetical protein
MTSVRALAFGDLEGASWGVAWVPEGAQPILALGAGRAARAHPATLTAQAGSSDWRLEAPDVKLLMSPIAGLASTGPPDARDSSHQLCRVSGRITVEGQEQTVECLGWRAESALAIDDDRLASLRQVCAWFEPDEGVSLLALRPEAASGQDADVISAALLEPSPTGPITDPRLSTTYGEDGRPARAGLELWLAEDSNDDAEEEVEHHYPRRLAGEAIGARIDWVLDGLALHAALFRWHFRDRDGAGVYLLGVKR